MRYRGSSDLPAREWEHAANQAGALRGIARALLKRVGPEMQIGEDGEKGEKGESRSMRWLAELLTELERDFVMACEAARNREAAKEMVRERKEAAGERIGRI